MEQLHEFRDVWPPCRGQRPSLGQRLLLLAFVVETKHGKAMQIHGFTLSMVHDFRSGTVSEALEVPHCHD